jgi:hypothetical protein
VSDTDTDTAIACDTNNDADTDANSDTDVFAKRLTNPYLSRTKYNSSDLARSDLT